MQFRAVAIVSTVMVAALSPLFLGGQVDGQSRGA